MNRRPLHLLLTTVDWESRVAGVNQQINVESWQGTPERKQGRLQECMQHSNLQHPYPSLSKSPSPPSSIQLRN